MSENAEVSAIKFIRQRLSEADMLRPLLDTLQESNDARKLIHQRRNELRAVEDQMKTVERRLNVANSQIADVDNAVATAVAERERQLDVQEADLKHRTELMLQDEAALQRRKDEAKRAIELETESAREGLKKEAAEARGLLNRANDAVNALDKRAAGLRQEIANLESQLGALKSRINQV